MKMLRDLTLERLLDLREKEKISALWNKAIDEGHKLEILNVEDLTTTLVEEVTVELINSLIEKVKKGLAFGLLTDEDPSKARTRCEWWEIIYCP